MELTKEWTRTARKYTIVYPRGTIASNFEPFSISDYDLNVVCHESCFDETFQCIMSCDSTDSECVYTCIRAEAVCIESKLSDCLIWQWIIDFDVPMVQWWHWNNTIIVIIYHEYMFKCEQYFTLLFRLSMWIRLSQRLWWMCKFNLRMLRK